MACSEEQRDRLVEFARGALSAHDADALIEHTQACSACSEEFDVLAGVTRALDREAAARAAPGRGAARRWTWTPRRLSAAAAVLLAGALGLWFAGGPGPRALSDLARIDPVPFVEGALRGGAPEREPRFRAAMEAYSSGDFAAAAPALAALLVEDADDHKLRIYLGISYLNLGRTAEAIAALEPARAGAGGLLGERALWYLAMAHLLREDGAAAQSAFEELAARRGSYRKNAEEMLEKLKEL